MPLLIVRSTINTEWGEGIRDKTSRIDNVNRNGLTPQFRREFKVFLVVSTLHKVLCQQHQEKLQSNMPQRTKWYKMVHSAQWKMTIHYTTPTIFIERQDCGTKPYRVYSGKCRTVRNDGGALPQQYSLKAAQRAALLLLFSCCCYPEADDDFSGEDD